MGLLETKAVACPHVNRFLPPRSTVGDRGSPEFLIIWPAQLGGADFHPIVRADKSGVLIYRNYLSPERFCLGLPHCLAIGPGTEPTLQ